MKIPILLRVFLLAYLAVNNFSCQKGVSRHQQPEESLLVSNNAPTPAEPPFNLEVILRGNGSGFGHVKFRQANDAEKTIILDTWIRDLLPNQEYLLQRAVDPINVVDGICTSDAWLTLGKGLTPQSILTDDNGVGKEELWRSVAALPSGSAFDIHFRIVDASSMAVVLTSDCYNYVVR